MKINIRTMLMTVLMLVTLVVISVMGFLLYQRFKISLDETTVSSTQAAVESTVDRLNSDFSAIRQLVNAANYNIIQENDISSQEFTDQLSLLYEVHSDQLQSLALYRSDGTLIASEPVAQEKENAEVSEQGWFLGARKDIENIQISLPHIQNLFFDGSYRYHRVISFSTAVDINDGNQPGMGVLLVDFKYSAIQDALDSINESSDGIYYYLCNRDGEIIYHPRETEINWGLFEEETSEFSASEDGIYEEKLGAGEAHVVVGSVAYTGWKVVGVVPGRVRNTSINSFRSYIFATILVLLMMLIQANRVISGKISEPIQQLDRSVKAYEAGGKPNIYIGGSSEIRHLGLSVQRSYERIEALMDEIIEQETKRRKSELAALQSQINPHFLYNTLESITWMVEAGNNDEAVRMISELGRLLRVSLSKGRTIIPISDEFQHSKSYMNIQRARYKNRFAVEFIMEDEIKNFCIVKLVIQPLLENAIYYGVGNMDEDDGGKIIIRGEKEGQDIYISVEDNGMGMRREVLENILSNNESVPKHGSGVGVINVHSRIQLIYGKEYGLEVYSEPDEGTQVVIHIPALPYTEENVEKLEMQRYGRGIKDDEES